MTRLEVSPLVRAICQSAAEQENVELVNVRFRSSGRRRVVEVTVDRDAAQGGVDFDLLSVLSNRISEDLDERDPIPGRYILELSSAGLERPLMKPADYERFLGRRIAVHCATPVEGRRRFEGTIASAGRDSFVLDPSDSTGVEIPYAAVTKAHLVVDWAQELNGIERRGEPCRRNETSLEDMHESH